MISRRNQALGWCVAFAIMLHGHSAWGQGDPVPGSRMFAATPGDVWAAVHAELRAAGLSVASSDQRTGVFVTKRYKFPKRGSYPPPTLENPSLRVVDMVLHGFVPSGVVPGRLYITAALTVADGFRESRVQGAGAENWILERVQARLGVVAEPVGRHVRDRAQQAVRLLAADDACVKRLLSTTGPLAPSEAEKVGEFRRLDSSAGDYPADLAKTRRTSRVEAQLELAEDGAVVDVSFMADGVKREPLDSFEVAFSQMMHRARFSPPLLDGCPVPLVVTVVGDFKLR